jgi:hypothetical protein
MKPGQDIDLLETIRGEREYYDAAGENDEVQMPFTRDGFEALLSNICEKYSGFKLPSPNDGLRVALVGLLHGIDPAANPLTYRKAALKLHQAVSNRSTWCIDQEIKAKAKVVMAELQEKAAREALEKQASEGANRRAKRAAKRQLKAVGSETL